MEGREIFKWKVAVPLLWEGISRGCLRRRVSQFEKESGRVDYQKSHREQAPVLAGFRTPRFKLIGREEHGKQ